MWIARDKDERIICHNKSILKHGQKKVISFYLCVIYIYSEKQTFSLIMQSYFLREVERRFLRWFLGIAFLLISLMSNWDCIWTRGHSKRSLNLGIKLGKSHFETKCSKYSNLSIISRRHARLSQGEPWVMGGVILPRTLSKTTKYLEI